MCENMYWKEYEQRVGSECEERWRTGDWIGADEPFSDSRSNMYS